MKLGSVVVFVILLATTVLAVTPMSPDLQMQALQLRLGQFEARYATFDTALQACGVPSAEHTAAWDLADANFNAFVTPLCGDPSNPNNYNTSTNQCVNPPYMTQAQQYTAMQDRIAQYVARYAALDVQATAACGQQIPQSAAWQQADAAMNAFLLANCGGYQNYSTSQNQCK